MLKFFFVLLASLLSIGTSYSQYMSFDDFIKLLDIAEERAEAEKFLKIKGFGFYNFEYLTDEDDEEGDTTQYMIEYYMKMPEDEYYIRVIGDTDEDLYTVMEFSQNEERSMYFASILAEAGLEPVNEWDKGAGYVGFDFEMDDYMITIDKHPYADEPAVYRFVISKY